MDRKVMTTTPERNLPSPAGFEPDSDNPDVADLDLARLLRCAAVGDTRAWERLVDKYGRLIWSITRDLNLRESDAADVFQTTWMRLIENIDRIEHADRIGSWLAATARNECLRCLATHKRLVLITEENVVLGDRAEHSIDVDEALLAGERVETVRAAMAHLPQRGRRLLELLMADPPVSYAEISDELGLPVGSIGPTRGRLLARLRGLLEAS